MEASQQYHASVGSHGYGANTASSILLSSNSSGLNFNSFEGYSNHQRLIPISYIQQSRVGHNLMNSTWLPLSLSHQTNLCQQYSSTTQASQLRTHHFGSASNSLIMKTNTSQSTISKHSVCQSLLPRLNQPSNFIENSPQSHWMNESNSGHYAINQVGLVPNKQGVDSVFEHNLEQGGLKHSVATGLDELTPSNFLFLRYVLIE